MQSLKTKPSNALGWALLAVMTILVGLPLVFVLVQGVAPGIGLTADWSVQPELLTEILHRPLWQTSLVNSLVLATGSMILGGSIGSGLAIMRHSTKFPGRRLLDVVVWTLLVSPSFILAQGWVQFGSPSGIAQANFGVDISGFLFSPLGLIVIMSLNSFPFAYLATSGALHWNNRSLTDAAALAGVGSPTILRTIRLPLVLPAILSGWILVFTDVIGDFGLPAALSARFSFPTLPYSIYASVRQSPVSFDLGGVLSFYLVVIILFATLIYLALLRKSRHSFLSGQATRYRPPKARLPWIWTTITTVVCLISLGIPIGTSLQVAITHTTHGGLAAENFTGDHFAEVFGTGSRMLEGLWNSLWIAVMAGIITTVVGFLIAVVLTFSQFKAKWLIDFASTVTLAVPGIVLAVGFIFVWNQPVLFNLGIGLYGSPALLIFIGVASALPVAIRLQIGALGQIPQNLLDAAALSGVGMWQRVRSILLPLALPAVISALAAVVASSVFDLAGTSMLAPPNFITLPVEILAEYDRGRFGYASAGALLSMVIVVILAVASDWIGNRLNSPQPTARAQSSTPTLVKQEVHS